MGSQLLPTVPQPVKGDRPSLGKVSSHSLFTQSSSPCRVSSFLSNHSFDPVESRISFTASVEEVSPRVHEELDFEDGGVRGSRSTGLAAAVAAKTAVQMMLCRNIIPRL